MTDNTTEPENVADVDIPLDPENSCTAANPPVREAPQAPESSAESLNGETA